MARPFPAVDHCSWSGKMTLAYLSLERKSDGNGTMVGGAGVSKDLTLGVPNWLRLVRFTKRSHQMTNEFLKRFGMDGDDTDNRER